MHSILVTSLSSPSPQTLSLSLSLSILQRSRCSLFARCVLLPHPRQCSSPSIPFLFLNWHEKWSFFFPPYCVRISLVVLFAFLFLRALHCLRSRLVVTRIIDQQWLISFFLHSDCLFFCQKFSSFFILFYFMCWGWFSFWLLKKVNNILENPYFWVALCVNSCIIMFGLTGRDWKQKSNELSYLIFPFLCLYLHPNEGITIFSPLILLLFRCV